jgi:sugar lactone lactonase YvrE
MARQAVDPKRWTPPPLPARAKQRSSQVPLPDLTTVELPGTGPEDVLVGPDGAVYTGLDDGRILRIANGDSTVVADTGGRPLGLEWLPDGHLLVCDARLGLLQVDAERGSVEVVVDLVAGTRMRFCNNAGVQSDGTVWFTDSSTKWGIDDWRGDLIEHGATGRLMRLDPDGSLHVVVEGLAFANGVACAPDGSWVAVAETAGYTVLSVDPATGETSPIEGNLPGFVDNISLGTDGLIWVALASPRQPLLDALLPKAPALRKLVHATPEVLQPKAIDTVWVQAYKPTGELVHDFQGRHPRMSLVTGVREHHGTVWLGSLEGSTIASFRLPTT